MAGVIYGRDAKPRPNLAQAYMRGVAERLQRQRMEQDIALAAAAEERALREEELRRKSTMAAALASARAQQLEGARLSEGQPGATRDLSIIGPRTDLPEQGPEFAGPPAAEVMAPRKVDVQALRHAPQRISGYTDPMTGMQVPDAEVRPLTEAGMLQTIRDKAAAELEGAMPFRLQEIRTKSMMDSVLAPSDIPELGVRRGERVDKDSLAAVFRARGDERAARSLEQSAANSARVAEMAESARQDRRDAATARAEEKATAAATTMRKEYNTVSTAIRTGKQQSRLVLGRMKEFLNDPNGVRDASLIVVLNKLLDPASVVRESEYDRYTNVGSVADRVEGWVNRLVAGEKLPPQARVQLFREVKALADEWNNAEASLQSNYADIADANGVDPKRLFGASWKRPPKLPQGFSVVGQ